MIKSGSKALLVLRASQAVTGNSPDLDSCLKRLDPQSDIGYDRIAARCPELTKQLEQSPWSAWLPRGWKEPGNDLSAGGLRQLRDVIARETATAPPNGGSSAAPVPDVRMLKTV